MCASVEGEGGDDNMSGTPDLDVMLSAKDDDLNVESVEAVGSYALQFHGSDGHWTGIYSWEYLRLADPALPA